MRARRAQEGASSSELHDGVCFHSGRWEEGGATPKSRDLREARSDFDTFVLEWWCPTSTSPTPQVDRVRRFSQWAPLKREGDLVNMETARGPVSLSVPTAGI